MSFTFKSLNAKDESVHYFQEKGIAIIYCFAELVQKIDRKV